jgi:hypothetical protein
MSKLFKTRPNKTAPQPLVVSVPEPLPVVVTEPTRVSDMQLVEDCRYIIETQRPIYARCQQLLGSEQPVLWCEQHCPRVAAHFWNAMDKLDSLLASRTYTIEQRDSKLAAVVARLNACVAAMAKGADQPITEEEAFAVAEKQAIILEASINKNEQLAFVRALQLLVD